MYSERDIETGKQLNPVYICLTCSEAGYNERKTDFDSNSVASRVNVETFSQCWRDVFYNRNNGLEKKFEIPKEDNQSIRGNYLVWSVTKFPQTPWGEVDFPTSTLNRTYIGIITEEFLKKTLPKTATDLKKQIRHFLFTS